MADPELTLGNPYINPTGWMQHPVDWELRRQELAAERAAEKHTLMDFLFSSKRNRPRKRYAAANTQTPSNVLTPAEVEAARRRDEAFND